jgi:hypothetical protein
MQGLCSLLKKRRMGRNAADFLRAFGAQTDEKTVAAFSRLCVNLPQIGRLKTRQGIEVLDTTTAHLFGGPVCLGCGNADLTEFDTTTDTSELVCIKCGVVAVDHMLFQGEAEREFEDDTENRVHASFPQRFSYLMSDEYNLETVVKTGDTVRTWRHGSQVLDGRTPTATSTKKRDGDKRRAIAAIEEAAKKLGVPLLPAVDAIELFASFRDDRQRIAYKEVLQAVCLFIAATAHDRKTPALSAEPPIPSVGCPHCSAVFVTTTERAKHWTHSQLCRMANRKKDVRRVSLPMPFLC